MEDYETKAIRVWMRQVMDSRSWSANRWATLAGTSPTNITRFLNGAKFTPSSKTLAKLVYVAGSSPQLSRAMEINESKSRVVPVYRASIEGVISAGAMSVYNLDGDIAAYISDFECATAVISVGDTIVIRKDSKMSPGDYILFVRNNKMMASTKLDNNSMIINSQPPEMLKIKDVKVLGQIVQVIKHYDKRQTE